MGFKFFIRAFLSLFIFIGSAQAADTLCGQYVWKHHDMTEVLNFYSDNAYSKPIFNEKNQSWLNGRGRYQIENSKLALIDWVYAGITNFATISSDKKRIIFDDKSDGVYVKTSKPCQSNPFPNQVMFSSTFPPETYDYKEACIAGNESECVLLADYDRDVEAMKKYCGKGMPSACERLFKSALSADMKLFNSDPDNPKWHSAYGKIRMSDQTLEQLGDFCAKAMPSKLCADYADALWASKRFAKAFEQVDLNCKNHIDKVQCMRVAAISSAERKIILNEQPTNKMPVCGDYDAVQTEGGFELDKNGVMKFPYGGNKAYGKLHFEEGELRTRLEDGNHVAFVVFENGLLLGVNEWDAFDVYHKTKAKVENCNK